MASLAFSLAFYGKIHIENLRQKYLGKGCLLLNMVNQGKSRANTRACLGRVEVKPLQKCV